MVGDIKGKTLFFSGSQENVLKTMMFYISLVSIFDSCPAELKTLTLLLFCRSDEHIVHEERVVGSTGNHTNLRGRGKINLRIPKPCWFPNT